MARLLIIVTTSGYDCLWSQVENWDSQQVRAEERAFEVKKQQIDGDLAVIFCHPEGSVEYQRREATKQIQVLARFFPNSQEVYIAAHSGRVNWKEHGFGDRLKAYADFDHYCINGSGGEDGVYDAVLEFVREPTPDKFNKVVEQLKKKTAFNTG